MSRITSIDQYESGVTSVWQTDVIARATTIHFARNEMQARLLVAAVTAAATPGLIS